MVLRLKIKNIIKCYETIKNTITLVRAHNIWENNHDSISYIFGNSLENKITQWYRPNITMPTRSFIFKDNTYKNVTVNTMIITIMKNSKKNIGGISNNDDSYLVVKWGKNLICRGRNPFIFVMPYPWWHEQSSSLILSLTTLVTSLVLFSILEKKCLLNNWGMFGEFSLYH